MSSTLALFFLSLLGSVAGLIGGVIFLFQKDWARHLAKYATPFAAGVLLAVSFLDLLPEAVEAAGAKTFTVVLVIFVLLFLIERFLFHLHHHSNGKGAEEGTVPMVIFGDTIHNFLDGVAIAAAFLIEPKLGLVVALSTFLHETPHEIADFGILLANGWNKNRAFLANLLSALATIPGAFLTYFYASSVESLTGILLAAAAGLFLYVAATDFLPETKKDTRGGAVNVVFFLLGIILMVLVKRMVPEISG